MEPITAISGILSSIKTATDIAKFFKSTDSSIKNAEYKLKIAELIEALAEVKLKMVEVKEIIAEKDQIIKELKEKLNLEDKVKYIKPHCWKIDENSKDGPFCPNCWDDKRKLIRPIDYENGAWKCPKCGQTYTDKSFDDNSPSIEAY